MSLRTRIKGFTAWLNLRLKPFDHLTSNVMMDLLTGTNLKVMLESMTGRDFKRLETMDGLTQDQKTTRVEWMLAELKKCKVIPEDIYVDCRMFAMRSADHIFKLLWRLVSHDIWFIWERAEYLQHANNKILSEVPLKWVPEPPPVKKRKIKTRQSLLSGFGASATIEEKTDEDETEIVPNYERYPRSQYMMGFKDPVYEKDNYPTPESCILELVNTHLKMVFEGQKINCMNVDDLVDSRILCALVNSIVPNTFTTEVLLNDRWTINLILRTIEKMLYMDTPFDSEDLVEADTMTVCSYFCAFFMTAYKYRQAKAVVARMGELHRAMLDCQEELDILPSSMADAESIQQKHQLKMDLDHIKQAIQHLEKKYEIMFFRKWMEHVQDTQKETHKLIRHQMKKRFDMIKIPRTITINDLCLSLVINLTLSGGSGFYKLEHKESVSENRKLVLRDKESGDFTDDFTGRNKVPVRKMLKLPLVDVVEIDPDKFTKYDIFIQAQSRNKQVKQHGTFLYAVFPGTTSPWQKIFLRAAKENEIETVHRLLVFFRTHPSFVNCREPNTGNTALHIAARWGHYDMVELLLENGANIDQKNSYKQTPIFSACEGLHRDIAHLLIEWGCDVHARGPRGQTAFETIKNDEFRHYLIDAYDHYSTVVPQVMEGDTDLLKKMIEDHIMEVRQLNNLRSRCINGSTLIHTASYFGRGDLIRDLLSLRIDVNLLDYKGATPLHRAKDVPTMKILMDAGARTSIEDLEGNTPLHVKCYGEAGKPSESEAINALIEYGAKLTARNTRGLMPIHCCAMQGRIDVIQQLLSLDKEGLILAALNSETKKTPPSVVNLSVANDYIQCASWLRGNGFNFKDGEQDALIRRILTEQIKLNDRAAAVQFLLDEGASVNPVYPGGNSALHFAACMSGSNDVLQVLIENGADINGVNDEHATPLFFACQCNNQYAASMLIDKGVDVRLRNMQGLTALDFILDFDEWIECGYFTDEIRARLKAYSLKHTRDLIRAISKKVKAPPALSLKQSLMARPQSMMSGFSMSRSVSGVSNFSLPTGFASSPLALGSSPGITLPPLQRHQGFLTY